MSNVARGAAWGAWRFEGGKRGACHAGRVVCGPGWSQRGEVRRAVRSRLRLLACAAQAFQLPLPRWCPCSSCLGRVGVDPWATFPTGLRTPKPHRSSDPAAAALAAVVARDGKLRLRHFSRVGGWVALARAGDDCRECACESAAALRTCSVARHTCCRAVSSCGRQQRRRPAHGSAQLPLASN